MVSSFPRGLEIYTSHAQQVPRPPTHSSGGAGSHLVLSRCRGEWREDWRIWPLCHVTQHSEQLGRRGRDRGGIAWQLTLFQLFASCASGGARANELAVCGHFVNPKSLVTRAMTTCKAGKLLRRARVSLVSQAAQKKPTTFGV